MKFIEKKHEPETLARYRREMYASYDGFGEKDELRQILAEEQGYLCCYCMGRIEPHPQRMKIEHHVPQSLDSSRALDYRNLLGACKGGEGERLEMQHCDTRKADQTLHIDPTDRSCEQKIRYNLGSGEVYSNDVTVQHDLDSILNLNLPRLVRNRRNVLNDALAEMEQRHPGTWTVAFIEKERERWMARNVHGKYAEYCVVVLNYLDRKLNRALAKR